jgi:anaerobic magnesium-protoporphyrin IX monomethyl ester cyclase
MKIVLIELSVPDTSAIGVRSLSACLKRAGHQAVIVFLGNSGHRTDSGRVLLADEVVEQVAGLCRGADLVGVSFLSSGFHRAAQVAQGIRQRLSVPVIWGGIHATVAVEACLEHADGVCRGEGEQALLELVERMSAGKDYLGTENFCFKEKGRIIRNPVRPLIQDLDALPYLDYDRDAEHYGVPRGANELRRLDWELQRQFLTPTPGRPDIGTQTVYTTMMSRGCPHRCSYCFHSLYRPMYQGQRYLRRRSAASVVDEISRFRARYGFDGVVWFADDDFTAMGIGDVETFAAAYRQGVGLKFFCLGSPTTITEKKLGVLTAAGLSYFELGIQTGSEATKNMFHRSFSNAFVIRQAALLNTFKKQIPLPFYDFILDSPWETEADEIDTLELALQIPKPRFLALASFRYFPGSALYDKAVQEGWLKADSDQSHAGEFWRLKGKYSNFLLFLYASCGLPGALVRMLAARTMFRLFNRAAFAPLYAGAFRAFEIGQYLFRKLTA